jgi:hypothetical protein
MNPGSFGDGLQAAARDADATETTVRRQTTRRTAAFEQERAIAFPETPLVDF